MGKAGGAKNRARVGQFEFSLSAEHIRNVLAAGFCEVTGIAFEMSTPRFVKSPWAPSLDRKDPRVGYTPENTRVVVACFNFAKGVWGDQAVMIMARALVASEPS
jgi:hypothetical protein